MKFYFSSATQNEVFETALQGTLDLCNARRRLFSTALWPLLSSHALPYGIVKLLRTELGGNRLLDVEASIFPAFSFFLFTMVFVVCLFS